MSKEEISLMERISELMEELELEHNHSNQLAKHLQMIWDDHYHDPQTMVITAQSIAKQACEEHEKFRQGDKI